MRSCLRCGIVFRDSETTIWCPATDCHTTPFHERPGAFEGGGTPHAKKPILRSVHFRDDEEFESWLKRKEQQNTTS